MLIHVSKLLSKTWLPSYCCPLYNVPDLSHQLCYQTCSWYWKRGSSSVTFKAILTILTQNSRKFGLSAWKLVTDLDWNQYICTKHAPWDNLGWYWKWGSLTLKLQGHFGHFDSEFSPCGCGDLSVRLGSRISPHRNRVVVEVHWRGAQGWRSISWVVATFNHVGGSFNLSMAATGDVWIIPSFRIWGYVLHVEHISCVITNCGQLQWAIPSLFSIAL